MIPNRMLITDLADYPRWIPALARWHFEYWGLAGTSSLAAYRAVLASAADSRMAPSILIAVADGTLLGSITLMACDLG
jgi:hypothetical protein